MLISEDYRALQRALHESPDYGVASLGFVGSVRKLIEAFGVRSVTDYGAGKQNLRKGLEAAGVVVDYRPYDPAFPEYGAPLPADLVCCIDVLEHIEPDHLGAVLDDLRRVTTVRGFFTIHTGPARKVLADGRNAHLIQEPLEWWLPRLEAHFRVIQTQATDGGFIAVVEPRAAA
ncbi:MAG: hypothetical protein WC718_01420 [Phycisphaerales bacterium]